MQIKTQGPLSLQKALIEELESLGFEASNSKTDILKYLETGSDLGININIPAYPPLAYFPHTRSIRGTEGTYTLPQDWDMVLHAVRAETQPKYKVGDYVYWTQNYGDLGKGEWFDKGDVARIEDIYSNGPLALHSPHRNIRGGFDPRSYGHQFRKATPEEIEAFLKKEAVARGFVEGQEITWINEHDQPWAAKIYLTYDKEADTLKAHHHEGDLSMALNKDGSANYDFTHSKAANKEVGVPYRNGKWVTSKATPYKPKPTLKFGGKTVELKVDKLRNDVLITVEGVKDWYTNAKKLKQGMDSLQSFKFGTYAVQGINDDKTLRIGCTTGLYSEYLAVMKACADMLFNAGIVVSL